MIYFAQTPTGSIKIGTTDNLPGRMSQLAGHYGTELVLLTTMPGDKKKERSIHKQFSHLRLGRTEQFRPGSDLMEFIGKPLLVGANPEAVEAEGRKMLGYRVGPQYLAWLEKVARKNRSKISGLLDQAVAKYALDIGVVDIPPDRTA
jgi:hypothetical protein